MEFKDSQTNKCFRCVCLWSLFGDLLVIFIFLTGFIITRCAASQMTPDSLQGFTWMVMVIPAIATKILLSCCFVAANVYLAFISHQEHKTNTISLSLKPIYKTEEIFNKSIKNKSVKSIIIYISIFSYILNSLISMSNPYALFVIFITFTILLLITKIKR